LKTPYVGKQVLVMGTLRSWYVFCVW